MSDPDDTQPKVPAESNGLGVLANLPRTRPQRSSPRRAAARASASAATKAPAAPGKTGSSKTSPEAANGAGKTSADAASGAGKASPAGTSPSKAPKRKAATRSKPAAARASDVAPAPRQGFECESEHPGRTINPPGGAELVASVAEIVGEFAKTGLSAGERLLKDALSRLPLS